MKTVAAMSSMLLGTVMMQAPAKPPMKMGLWETETQTKMNMPNAPAFMSGMMNRKVHVKSCVTPESYQKSWVTSQQQQKDCMRQNEVWTDHGVSFDMTCNKGKATVHTEMTWESDASAHGTVRLDTDGKGTVISNSTVSTHWVGPDCGDVTPDKPVFTK